MRTTVSIDDTLLARAKDRARAQGITLGAYVEQALTDKLAAGNASRSGPPVPVFRRGTGLVDGVDATSNRALYESLGGE